MELREQIEIAAKAFQAQPAPTDESLSKYLRAHDIDDASATKLIQFLPIAFCRFIMRDWGIQFAPNYLVMDQRGKQIGDHLLADEPVFSEALAYCDAALAEGQKPAFFLAIAARSGGYKSIQQLIAGGSNPDGIITSPPILQGKSPMTKKWWNFRK